MTRAEAEALADKLCLTLAALDGHPEHQAGVRCAILMLEEIITASGRIDKHVFLKRCGLKNLDKALRELDEREREQRRLDGMTALQRRREALKSADA